MTVSPYQEIRKAFIDFIQSEGYEIGDKIPTEDELSKILKVSRVTLREAIRQLREEGFIYSRRGSGTYLSGNVKEIVGTLDVNNGLTVMISEAGFTPGVTEYTTELISASEMLAEKLRVDEGCGIVLLKRVRTANDEPVLYSLDYLSPAVAPLVLSRNEKIMSLFAVIEESGVSIGSSFAQIIPENCPAETAKKLAYKPGGAILALKQVLVDRKGNPLFYGEDYFRPDCFVFTINRKRHPL
jgi:GntR family transcriptional regulator